MTIEDAIKHCRDTALSNAGNAIAYLKGGQKMLAESCEKCAAEHEQLAKWLEELKRRREAETWIPCSERLPEQSEEGQQPNVKCSDCVMVTDGRLIHMAYFVNDSWCFADCGEVSELVEYKVTHWMPLPEPPEKERYDAYCTLLIERSE